MASLSNIPKKDAWPSGLVELLSRIMRDGAWDVINQASIWYVKTIEGFAKPSLPGSFAILTDITDVASKPMMFPCGAIVDSR